MSTNRKQAAILTLSKELFCDSSRNISFDYMHDLFRRSCSRLHTVLHDQRHFICLLEV